MAGNYEWSRSIIIQREGHRSRVSVNKVVLPFRHQTLDAKVRVGAPLDEPQHRNGSKSLTVDDKRVIRVLRGSVGVGQDFDLMPHRYQMSPKGTDVVPYASPSTVAEDT